MNLRSIAVLLSVCCSFMGCAVSTTTLKHDWGEKNYVTYFFEIPIGTSYITNRDLIKFQDPNQGSVYAPQYHVPAEFRIGSEYKAHVNNKVMLCPGARISYLYETADQKNIGMTGNEWGTSYSASLDPSVILEPYLSSEINIRPIFEGASFLEVGVGVPVMQCHWRKYYSLHVGTEAEGYWERHYLENTSFWYPGLSWKIGVHQDFIGLRYEMRFSQLQIDGEKTNIFSHALIFSMDLMQTRRIM